MGRRTVRVGCHSPSQTRGPDMTEGVSILGSPGPGTNVQSPCVQTDPPCSGMAASRCPTRACLIHCRQIRAVAAGMDPQVAAEKSVKGELAGMGCEAHEAKYLAKQEKASLKRKSREDTKAFKKLRRAELRDSQKAHEEKKQGKQPAEAGVEQAVTELAV